MILNKVLLQLNYMRRLLIPIKRFFSTLIERGKKVEQEKAAKKWDSIVEELRNRK
tara:strand:+ start:717 stop:881 length:165 start_codon:yes stop_codon:yes gene_type:complete